MESEHKEGDILKVKPHVAKFFGVIKVWEDVFIKKEPAPECDKWVWMDSAQCPDPACGDIGQHYYNNKGEGEYKHVFYCPYCYTHYYRRYKEIPADV